MIYPKNEWIPISEKEYNEEYNKACPETDDELLDKINQSVFNMKFRKDPIYKEPGFHNLMEENPEIIGYNYYKEGGFKFYIVGSVEQIKKWEKEFFKMMLNEN